MFIYIKKNILSLSLAILLLGTAGCGSGNKSEAPENGAQEKPATPVENPTVASLTEGQMKAIGLELGSIENKPLTATLRANGILRVPNNDKANVTALYGGVVKTLLIQMGDYVKKGQVVATIANPQFVQLQEEYISLKNQILLAGQELQRQNELLAGNAGAGKNKQIATANLGSLQTRRASLYKQIQMMGINPNVLDNRNMNAVLLVKSPISGTVSNVFAKIGSYVDVTQPVAEIVDNRQLHLDLQIFEKDLYKVKVGQAVHFALTNNPEKDYMAEVYSVGASFENDSKTVSVHCKVRDNKTGLIDSMNVTGLVSLDKSTVPAVPDKAIVNYDGKYYIFVVSDKKTVDGHQPEKGSRIFERIEIMKGTSELGFTAITPVSDLPPNTKVVTKSAFFINAKLTNTGEED